MMSEESLTSTIVDPAFRAWIREGIPKVLADVVAQRLDPQQSVGLLAEDCPMVSETGPIASAIPREKGDLFIAMCRLLGSVGDEMADKLQSPPAGTLAIFCVRGEHYGVVCVPCVPFNRSVASC
jgi:hypothetical protein